MANSIGIIDEPVAPGAADKLDINIHSEALIDFIANSDKQYVDEYEELLQTLNTPQIRLADYSHIVNLGHRLGVTPAPHIISNPDNPSP